MAIGVMFAVIIIYFAHSRWWRIFSFLFFQFGKLSTPHSFGKALTISLSYRRHAGLLGFPLLLLTSPRPNLSTALPVRYTLFWRLKLLLSRCH